jgi:predicted Zn-dependent peptidase
MSTRLDDGVWHTSLPGGATVLTETMDSVRSVAVGFWFRCGTAHERPGERGISHLLEHMVFKGTKRRSARQIALEIEGVGGGLDAYTTHDHTSLQARIPAEYVDRGLDVLSDLAFRPALRQEDLDLEREVVLEELARVEGTPEDLVFELHAAFLYGGHPYGAPILGTRESLTRIDTTALRRVRGEAYTPQNLVVAAAGSLDHERFVEAVQRLIPEANPSEHRKIAAPTGVRTGLQRVERPGGRQVHIVAGCQGIEYTSPLRHAAIIVNTALGGGMSSRLFQRIREEQGLAYSVFSFQSFHTAGGHLGAYLGTREETAEEARSVLEGEFRSIATEGLGAKELEETRRQIKGQLALTLEAPAARMHRLAATGLYEEPYDSLQQIAERIDGVTEEELVAAGHLYRPDALAILELWPA